jgi:hypothetical protein
MSTLSSKQTIRQTLRVDSLIKKYNEAVHIYHEAPYGTFAARLALKRVRHYRERLNKYKAIYERRVNRKEASHGNRIS